MVRTYNGRHRVILVLSPNLSMSWKLNLYLIGAVGAWSVLLGIVFLSIGAWPILPFMGLELACLAAALWLTQRKLNCREVLSISDSSVVYEQGVSAPSLRIMWPRQAVRGQVLRLGHPLQSPEIALYDSSGRHCRIGAFLNKDDCDLLIQLLKKQGIHLRTDLELLRVPF